LTCQLHLVSSMLLHLVGRADLHALLVPAIAQRGSV
jgi:hypothetical protein